MVARAFHVSPGEVVVHEKEDLPLKALEVADDAFVDRVLASLREKIKIVMSRNQKRRLHILELGH